MPEHPAEKRPEGKGRTPYDGPRCKECGAWPGEPHGHPVTAEPSEKRPEQVVVTFEREEAEALMACHAPQPESLYASARAFGKLRKALSRHPQQGERCPTCGSDRPSLAGWVDGAPCTDSSFHRELRAAGEDGAVQTGGEERGKLIERLAPLYRKDRVVVAAVCDEVLDRSGALLGELRKYVRAAQTTEGSEPK